MTGPSPTEVEAAGEFILATPSEPAGISLAELGIDGAVCDETSGAVAAAADTTGTSSDEAVLDASDKLVVAGGVTAPFPSTLLTPFPVVS